MRQRKEVNKVVNDAKFKAYDDLFNTLKAREGEKDTSKLATIRKRKSKV